MTSEQIRAGILEIQIKHGEVGDELGEVYLAELYELEAERLIVDYCVERGYLVNGFPTEKRSPDGTEDEDEEYFTAERYRLYLDSLAVEKDDVAELLWFYSSTFWPDLHEGKAEYVEGLKFQLAAGFHDVEF